MTREERAREGRAREGRGAGRRGGGNAGRGGGTGLWGPGGARPPHLGTAAAAVFVHNLLIFRAVPRKPSSREINAGCQELLYQKVIAIASTTKYL